MMSAMKLGVMMLVMLSLVGCKKDNSRAYPYVPVHTSDVCLHIASLPYLNFKLYHF